MARHWYSFLNKLIAPSEQQVPADQKSLSVQKAHGGTPRRARPLTDEEIFTAALDEYTRPRSGKDAIAAFRSASLDVAAVANNPTVTETLKQKLRWAAEENAYWACLTDIDGAAAYEHSGPGPHLLEAAHAFAMRQDESLHNITLLVLESIREEASKKQALPEAEMNQTAGFAAHP